MWRILMSVLVVSIDVSVNMAIIGSDNGLLAVWCQAIIRTNTCWLYPRSTKGGMGVYWIHPNVRPFVRPSVRPSVCRQCFRNFLKKNIGSIHFIPGIYLYGVSLLTPIHFRVPSLIFVPLVAKYLAENGVSGTFLRNYWLNPFHTWHLPLWCESIDPYTFSCS